VPEPQARPDVAAARLPGMLAEQHARILRHDGGARLAHDPEDLHQVRVAVRRTRAILPARLLRDAGGTGAAFAAGRLVERERLRRSEARRALPAARKKLERRGVRAWS
jgi:CHAD domain